MSISHHKESITGIMILDLKKSELQFKSTSIDYMLVTEEIVYIEGLGQIKNQGEYKYQLRINGDNDSGFLCIKIWDDNRIIYDNALFNQELSKGIVNVKSLDASKNEKN